MSIGFGFSKYFPNRAPTWTEVVLAVLFAGSIAIDFLSPSIISWPAVIVGFVVSAIAVGPAAATSLGKGIGHWFRGIGIGGRAAVIILFASGVAVLFQLDSIPRALINDAASGGLLALILYMVAYVAWAGEVSGWKT